MTTIEESANPADGEALATEELVVQEDLDQTPVAEEQGTTPTEAETVPAAEAEVETAGVEEVAAAIDAGEIQTSEG